MKRLFVFLTLMVALSSWGRGLQFAEEMRGNAYYDGEFRNASVSLKIVINDIDAWRANPNYAATVTGTLYMDRLPSQPITGTLVILAPAAGMDGRLLTYRLSSSTVQFNGAKHVRDNAGADVIDYMTTLHGIFQPKGQVPPPILDLLGQSLWTSELHFEWWDVSVVWNFSNSFKTISTPWYEDLIVKAIFVKTMLGALASTLFPWAL